MFDSVDEAPHLKCHPNVCGADCDCMTSKHRVIGKAIGQRKNNGTAVRIFSQLDWYVIDEDEHTRNDLAGLSMAPEHFEGSTLVCSTFRDLVMSVDEVDMLRRAGNEPNVTATIRVALYKRYVSRENPLRW